MAWNWNWLSPWATAWSHADKVRDELAKEAGKGNKKAISLLDDICNILGRYEAGERSLKLYSAMFSISLKGISKYVK